MKADTYSQSFLPAPVDSPEGGLELGRLFGAIIRRLVVVVLVTGGVTAAAGWYARQERPVYRGMFEMLADTSTPETQVISSTQAGGVTGGDSGTAPRPLDETKLRELRSQELFRQCRVPAGEIPTITCQPGEIGFIDQMREKHPDFSFRELNENLRLRIPKQDSNLLEVEYRDPNPAKVLDVLRLILVTYQNYSRDSRLAQITQQQRYVAGQIEIFQDEVAKHQGDLQALRRRFNVIDPQTRTQQINAQLSTLNGQLQETELNLQREQSVARDLATELRDKPVEQTASIVLRESALYQRLLTQLFDLDGRIAQESTRYQNDHPVMVNLFDERARLLPLLSRAAEKAQQEHNATVQDLVDRRQTIVQSITALRNEERSLSDIERAYDAINRQLQFASENLSLFLTRQTSLGISANQRDIRWQTITSPPTQQDQLTRDGANFRRNVMLGAGLGLILGIASALLLDWILMRMQKAARPQTRSAPLPAGSTQLPLLGVIPYEAPLDSGIGIPHEMTKHYMTSFQALYGNLLLADRTLRSLAVGSAGPAEGKTTVALNLARAAASTGQQVLLVDANLRRPQLQKLTGIPGGRGLADLLGGDLVEPPIQKMPTDPNLFLLPAGSTQQDPAKLLASVKMQRLVEQMAQNYDLVIYDTPHLLDYADASILSACADGMLLVVGLGQIKQETLGPLLAKLEQADAAVVGMVANGVKSSVVAPSRGLVKA